MNEGSKFLHILINPDYVCFFLKITAILVSVKWCLSIVLICISLMTNDIDYLFVCLVANYIFS